MPRIGYMRRNEAGRGTPFIRTDPEYFQSLGMQEEESQSFEPWQKTDEMRMRQQHALQSIGSPYYATDLSQNMTTGAEQELRQQALANQRLAMGDTSTSGERMAAAKEKRIGYKKDRQAQVTERAQDHKLRREAPQAYAAKMMVKQFGDLEEASPLAVGAAFGPKAGELVLEGDRIQAGTEAATADRDLRTQLAANDLLAKEKLAKQGIDNDLAMFEQRLADGQAAREAVAEQARLDREARGQEGLAQRQHEEGLNKFKVQDQQGRVDDTARAKVMQQRAEFIASQKGRAPDVVEQEARELYPDPAALPQLGNVPQAAVAPPPASPGRQMTPTARNLSEMLHSTLNNSPTGNEPLTAGNFFQGFRPDMMLQEPGVVRKYASQIKQRFPEEEMIAALGGIHNPIGQGIFSETQEALKRTNQQNLLRQLLGIQMFQPVPAERTPYDDSLYGY